MKLNHIFYFAMIIMLTLLPIFPANAQQTPLVQNLPQIHVIDLSIPQRQMKAGDVVKGTFTLFNNSQTNAPDVSYLVALVGDFKNNQPTTVFDTKDIGKSFLSAGEKKIVNFTYQLPVSVAGNELGIRIQTMFAGLYMGWEDAKIAVVGKSALAKIVSAKLVVDGKEFVSETGPVVPKGKSVDYLIKFSNPTTEAITFTPSVKIFNRMSTGELLQEFSGESVAVPAKSTAQTTINLPTFDYKPLVYAVEVEFLDAQGETRAPSVTGRYMILGDMATIQSVAANKTSVAKSGTVNVTVFYQPPPFDQFSPTGERPQVGEADLTVMLFNENNGSIGLASQKIDLDSVNTSAVLAVTATGKARALGVTAVISKDGVELSKYSAQLTPPTEGAAPADAGNLGTIFMFIIIAVIVSVIGAVLLAIIKKNKNTPTPPPSAPTPPVSTPSNPTSGIPTAAIALLIVGAALAVSLGLAAKIVSASATFTGGTKTGHGDLAASNQRRIPDVFVNSPIDGSHFSPGSNFNLEMRQVYNFCGSSLGSAPVTWTITLDGETETYVSANVINQTYSFSLKAPSEPGTYRIDIKVDDLIYGEHYWVSGYINIIVDQPPLATPTLSQPTEGPGGGDGGTGCLDDIKLNWSAVTGASKYEIYRDSVILAEVSSPATTYTDSAAAPGTHTYYVVAVADGNRSANSNTVSATKCANTLSITLTPNPNPAVANTDTVTWTATPGGNSCGSGNYTFHFVGGDGVDQTTTGSIGSITHKYHDPGNYSMTATVSRNGCETITQNSAVVVNPQNLSSITCEPSPKTAAVNQEVTWTAVPNPDGDYTYTWSGDNGLSGSTKIVKKSYSSPGIYRAKVDVTGVGNSHCESTVNVKINPNFQEI